MSYAYLVEIGAADRIVVAENASKAAIEVMEALGLDKAKYFIPNDRPRGRNGEALETKEGGYNVQYGYFYKIPDVTVTKLTPSNKTLTIESYVTDNS